MIILGIDPGSARTGYGVIKTGNSLQLIDCGIIGTDRKKSEDQILENSKKLADLIKKYRPALIGIEKLYFSKNVKTGIAVAQSRGAILLEIMKHGLPFKELSPSEVKLAITGYGLSDKHAVAKMVKLILNVSQNNLKKYDDATDALAIAIAAANALKYRG
jgi:crossover junction endodeoxyribonuclease RuvC